MAELVTPLRDGVPDPRTPDEALRLIAEYECAPGYGNPTAGYLSAIARRGLALIEGGDDGHSPA